MVTTFQCPDCRAIHDEPAEAAFAFVARCLDCAFDAEVARTEPAASPLPAAA